ncbi:predicted protein [Plenodomus lingam JN3]|uniref:Predicted protein n=1 Tax=Leptosphaeria maculans (strain JN3 / isolate v23.1.3 / race Av1-4-5-6-7-8) TaxID=985895 RepID=E4ZNW9_LEPMJ|nr:predicted protein [Plenodomus lingam JN3]CBX93338.1 predicted protein [Plenodomus lingam JN3]
MRWNVSQVRAARCLGRFGILREQRTPSANYGRSHPGTMRSLDRLLTSPETQWRLRGACITSSKKLRMLGGSSGVVSFALKEQ